MTTESDKLRLMIDSYPDEVTNIDVSLTSIQARIDELTLQKSAVQIGVLDIVKSEMDIYLESKRVSGGWDVFATFGEYGVSNIIDWAMFDYITDSNTIIYITDDQFTVANDHSAEFTDGTKIVVDCGVDGFRYRTVDGNAVFTTVTTVDLISTETALTSNAEEVGLVTYEYDGIGWDSDATIVSKKTEFDFGYDHIYLDLGTSGTYGLDDMISKLNDGKGLLTLNKAKYNDAITKYERFAT